MDNADAMAGGPMGVALAEARAAAARGEVPVGAVVVREGRVVASAGNNPRALRDPSAHAEILAMRRACEVLGDERLSGCDLYVTLEPCTMCAAAISFARIRRLYFGATDPKGGAVESASFRAPPATTLRRSTAASGKATRPRCCGIFLGSGASAPRPSAPIPTRCGQGGGLRGP
jgi:tRNA(Arg) A34 adenosine deaminase TadA